MSLETLGTISPQTLGTIGTVGGATITTVGLNMADDDSLLGTTTTGMGTTVSSVLNNPGDFSKEATNMQNTQAYIESMNQEELSSWFSAIENKELELINNNVDETPKAFVKKL